MSSGKHSKGALTGASVPVVVILVAALVQEFGALIAGSRGGAFSHVVWWALGEPFTWRWALVGAPIVGLMLWASVHFLFQWGTGFELFVIIISVFTLLGVAVLIQIG